MAPPSPVAPSLAVAAVMPSVRISEIHYDNAGTDQGEAVEVSFPVGTNLTGWKIVRFNGNTATAAVSYATPAPAAGYSETLSLNTQTTCAGGTRGVVVVRYLQDGIQNGPNDGLALVNGTQVVELLSYEGPFTVAAGQAVGAGLTSTDIGVSQSGSSTLDPIGASLQRNADGTWSRTTVNSFGACNDVTAEVGPLDHVAITGGATTIAAGASAQFTATAQDAGNQTVATAAITWASSNTAVATVDNTGKVTGVAASADPVTLTATAVDNGLTRAATTTVTISAPPPAATVTVTPSTWSLKAGQTKTFAATAVDANGQPTATTFTWSILNPSVATIDAATGLVTGKTVGTTTVMATSANGKVGSATLTVTSAATLSLTSGKTSLAYGMQTQFFYSGVDASGTPVTSLVWSTSNPAIITVDQKGVVTGKGLGQAQLVGTAPDGTTASKDITIYLAAGATIPLRLGHNTEFGEPKDADASDDFIIRRAQYTVSYNASRGGANWVSWNIDPSHIGDSGRCSGTCYSADTVLSNAGLTAYTTADWVSRTQTDIGYDRGHMAPSADWTSSEADNNTTFFLSNFLPQRPDLNQGPWEVMESALRDSVKAGREAYVIAGGIFTNGVGLGTLLNLGKIGIPDSTYKIVVFTPLGTGIAADGTLPANSTVLAVNMPNVQGIRTNDWKSYATTIGKIEKSTGYDFLALLADATECRVEGRNCAPTARISGAGTAGGDEGQTLAFSAATSTDPENDALSYQWSIDGQTAGVGASLSHTFADNGTYAVRLIAADLGGAADTATTMVTIANVSPTVGTLSTTSGVEGSAFTATGSFTDPGTDAWSAAVDYGDGSGVQSLALSGKSFTLSHTYVDNGSYQVKVTVTESDAEHGDGTRTTSVTIGNVAPTVNAFAGQTILQGEIYQSTGTFSDPGTADTFTATVSYGDGSAGATLALSGFGFSLQHTYTAAGAFTVTVNVKDNAGDTGSRTATVTVQTPVQGVSNLAAAVQALGDGTLATASTTSSTGGALTSGQITSLLSKLTNATQSLNRERDEPAIGILGAFINEIDGYVNAGNLSAAKGKTLTDYARRVIASIGVAGA